MREQRCAGEEWVVDRALQRQKNTHPGLPSYCHLLRAAMAGARLQHALPGIYWQPSAQGVRRRSRSAAGTQASATCGGVGSPAGACSIAAKAGSCCKLVLSKISLPPCRWCRPPDQRHTGRALFLGMPFTYSRVLLYTTVH